MINIPFVSDDELKKARDMEKVLFELPSSVVEFVGIKVIPAEEPIYCITIGCNSSVSTKLIVLAAHLQLRNHWAYEKLDISAFQGTTRKHESTLTS